MRLFKKISGHEFWIQYDRSAKVYEIFKSRDGSDYIGNADSLDDVLKVCQQYVAEF